MSLDESRGIVFVPTASPKYNFYGANRTGANLYGDCLLAITREQENSSGTSRWCTTISGTTTTAPHPSLNRASRRQDGRCGRASRQRGFVWVFDRETGKPLWPIEERPVPHSDMPGEETWPTQPFPLKPPPFARQTFTAKDLNPYMPAEESAHLLKEMQAAHNQGMFTPPATQNTVEMPGNNGGANFGAAASIPSQGLLYVVSKDLPAMLKLVLDEPGQTSTTGSPEERGRAAYIANCSLCHGADLKGQPPAIPSLADLGAQAQAGGSACDCEAGKRPHAFVR